MAKYVNELSDTISSFWLIFKYIFLFINTFVSFAIPSLQLRLTTSLFSNLDSKLKTNTQ
jgi:hypothetical protein